MYAISGTKEDTSGLISRPTYCSGLRSCFFRLLLRVVFLAIDDTSQQDGVGAVHRKAWDVEHV